MLALPISQIRREILTYASGPAQSAKDKGEHKGEGDRCHDREINSDISVRTLVFDVAWKK